MVVFENSKIVLTRPCSLRCSNRSLTFLLRCNRCMSFEPRSLSCKNVFSLVTHHNVIDILHRTTSYKTVCSTVTGSTSSRAEDLQFVSAWRSNWTNTISYRCFGHRSFVRRSSLGWRRDSLQSHFGRARLGGRLEIEKRRRHKYKQDVICIS